MYIKAKGHIHYIFIISNVLKAALSLKLSSLDVTKVRYVDFH